MFYIFYNTNYYRVNFQKDCLQINAKDPLLSILKFIVFEKMRNTAYMHSCNTGIMHAADALLRTKLFKGLLATEVLLLVVV